MKIIILMLVCSIFMSNIAFADMEQVSYNLRRMADAAENQNHLTACLSRLNLYSSPKDMLREADCLKFVERISKGKNK